MLTQRQATHCYDKAYNYIKNNGSKYFLSMGTDYVNKQYSLEISEHCWGRDVEYCIIQVSEDNS